MDLWVESHVELASRLGGIEQVVLPSADHMSILGEAAVVEGILRILETLRADPPA